MNDHDPSEFYRISEDSSTESLDNPPMPVRSWIRVVFALTITMGVMVVIFRNVVGFEPMIQALGQAKWEQLWIPTLLLGFTLVVSVWKWQAVLLAMNCELTFSRGIYSFLVAWPFSAITPSRAGDLVRSLCIRDRVPLLQGTTSIVIDRLFDIQCLMLLAAVGAFLRSWWLVGFGMLSGLIAIWILFYATREHWSELASWRMLRRLRPMVERIVESGSAVVRQPMVVAKLVGFSLVIWLSVLTMVYVLLKIFSSPISPYQVVALWPLATLVGLVPLTLAGMGTRDMAFLYLIEQTSQLRPEYGPVLLATFAYSLFSSWIFAVIGAPFSLHFMMKRSRFNHQLTRPNGRSHS